MLKKMPKGITKLKSLFILIFGIAIIIVLYLNNAYISLLGNFWFKDNGLILDYRKKQFRFHNNILQW